MERQMPTPARSLIHRGMVLAAASQSFWWTAVVIGFVTNEAGPDTHGRGSGPTSNTSLLHLTLNASPCRLLDQARASPPASSTRRDCLGIRPSEDRQNARPGDDDRTGQQCESNEGCDRGEHVLRPAPLEFDVRSIGQPGERCEQ